MTKPHSAAAGEALPEQRPDVAAAIAACDGDAAKAIAILFDDIKRLERRLALVKSRASHGFSRGFLHPSD